MTNSSNVQAAWINEEYECLIAGSDIHFGQLETIVSSIYDKEGQAHNAYESERGGRLTMDAPSDVPEGEVVYTSLQQALDAYDVTVPLAPTWIPKEYGLADMYVDYIPGHLLIRATYESDDATIYMHVGNVTDGSFSWVQKDDGEVREYKSNGISHYMMTNRSETLVVWLNEEYECLIAGTDVSFKQLETIIDSIYGRN